jgi:hypothetical protein
LLDGRLAQIRAVKLDQIEGTEHSGAVVLPVAQKVKDREAVCKPACGILRAKSDALGALRPGPFWPGLFV